MSSPAPAQPEVPDLIGHLLDDRFRIIEKIGEGGMATVYRAHDTGTGERVAVKILLPELARDAVAMARLRLEAELGGKLAHPNLCHIIRLGERADGGAYAVMPLLQGEMLCERAWRIGYLPLDVTAKFVRDMCAGLHLAHMNGIIHRDLKPENVMIARNANGTERAVVLDFGLAVAQEASTGARKLTKTGMVVGTPEFMSPEQVRGKQLDPRSDIYSLAFMTYELLTGQLPFGGADVREITIARLKGEAIPIRTRRPDLTFPEAVEQVLMKALAIDPDLRYATAPEFGEAFARAAADV